MAFSSGLLVVKTYIVFILWNHMDTNGLPVQIFPPYLGNIQALYEYFIFILLLLNNISNIKTSYSLLTINFFVTPKQGQNIEKKSWRAIKKISSCQVNTTSRWGIKKVGISIGSIFLLFSNESSWKSPSWKPGEIPGPHPLVKALQL